MITAIIRLCKECEIFQPLPNSDLCQSCVDWKEEVQLFDTGIEFFGCMKCGRPCDGLVCSDCMRKGLITLKEPVYTNKPNPTPHNDNLCACGGDAVYNGLCIKCLLASRPTTEGGSK